jgi:16S rRNA processing protein RimM
LEGFSRWVPLAEIARPHGVRGEVRLKVFNQDSDLLLDVESVRVGDRERIVDHARRANDAILMKLRGIDDRDAADTLRGLVIAVRRADFPELEAGEFYVCDVEGATLVFEGKEIGKVKTIRSYPSVEALITTLPERGELEIPLTDAFIESVDAEKGIVVLRDLPSA